MNIRGLFQSIFGKRPTGDGGSNLPAFRLLSSFDSSFTPFSGRAWDKTDLSDLSGKVEKIEAEPGNRWKTLVEKVILLVTAAVVGYILARVGL